jgi:formylglycine-generating enzyme required for sulfatase activity
LYKINKKNMRKLLFLLVFLSAFSAFSQDKKVGLTQNSTSLTIGFVTDEKDKPLDSVKIVVMNTNLPLRMTSTSGEFSFPSGAVFPQNALRLRVERRGYYVPFSHDGATFEISAERRKNSERIKIKMMPLKPKSPLRIAVLPYCMLGNGNPLQIHEQAFTATAARVYGELDSDKILPIPIPHIKMALQHRPLAYADYCQVEKMTALATELNADLIVFGSFTFADGQCQVETNIFPSGDALFNSTSFHLIKSEDNVGSLLDEMYVGILARLGVSMRHDEREAVREQSGANTRNTRALAENLNGTNALNDSKPAEAETHFKKAHYADPNFAPAAEGLTESYLAQGKTSDAKLIAEKNRKPTSKLRRFYDKIKTLLQDAPPVLPTRYTETIKGVSFDMIAIQGGTFTMGSPKDEVGRSSNEGQHEVTLSPYYLGETEVTVAMFEQFVKETKYQTDAEKNTRFEGSYMYVNGEWRTKKGVNWRHDVLGNIRPLSDYNHPVIHVSWNDAKSFCDWLSTKTGKKYGLPTEAQWEYAARAGNQTPFHTGDSLTTLQANYAGNYPYNGNAGGTYRGKTTPVKTFQPNAWGLYDMHGNVWEWCADWYGDYPTTAQTNPTGAATGSYRVLRGGSWFNIAQYCRSASRINYTPDSRSNLNGLRLCLAP